MTILITGGAGYIGSHMVLALKDAGETFLVVDNLSTGLRSAVPEGVPLIVADIGDEAAMGDIFSKHQISEVIHFAASIIVPESVAHPLRYYENNTQKTRSLLAVCVEHNVKRFVLSSTAAVYGNPQDAPVPETAPLAPMSPYGASKMMAERILQDTSHAHGLRYNILRYFNVAGADPQARAGQSSPNSTHLVKVAVEAALGKRERVQIFGTDYPTQDGTCIRDYIHVGDLAAAHLGALNALRGGADNDIFNCGYGRGFSVREVIAAVKKVSGVDFKVEEAQRRAGDPAHIVAQSTKMHGALSFVPRYNDLETIITHALAWERKSEGAAPKL